MKKTKIQKTRKYIKLASNYPIGDFLIRIKNTAMAEQKEVHMRKTKLIVAVAKKLKSAGFLNEVKVKGDRLTATLRYVSKKPILIDLKIISRPGLRIYKNANDLESSRGPSIFIVSTPSGIMTTREAIKKRVGGEVIVEIW